MSRVAFAAFVAGLACLASGAGLAQGGERNYETRPTQLRSLERDSATPSYRSPNYGSAGSAAPNRARMARGTSMGDLLEDYPPTVSRMRFARSRRASAAPAGLCNPGRPVRALSAQAALRLAWCLMEADRPLQAAPAFAQAVELGDAATRQEASYGRTLAYLRKDLTAEAAVAAADAPQSRQRNAEVGSVILEQRALAAFRDARYAETVLHLDDRSRFAPEQTDLLLLRAYAYLRLGRSDDADRVFRAVERSGVPEGAAGINAVQETLGLVRGD